ncbi:hypothetical protein CQ010_04510 [Arthrobacter sp. MYb211]|uniref:tetratricopeptide repeat protein n=1 Tax=Micrococcaceae TaxID=1268 RepID=UPI000CFDC0A2|nr:MULTISPECIES: hypothetical protein [unclassified Arthrobacter]PRA01165.1 hypothetical protein CQ017_01270 [Arthrobacter sp. MYb224]PRA06668.1 hypothetical protein CQ019_04635 [Arthrobacter sp. MYb229]PRA13814.1 hypothetical protein CQ015_00505 [Arthrobacter sp. MYb221]PRB53569.1 hypothetical protein CQ013_04635 [Arthrobacter sp. MYb216]PRC09184.1 hypothetical protein CQ010_04510 [Arthrobacter sp. MYb211]
MSEFTAYAIDVASVNHDGVGTSIDGVLIDPSNLRPFITDEQAADRSMRSGTPTDQVVIHMARGELAQAGNLIAESRLSDPTNAHLRVLDTELTRLQGDFDRAINRLRKLVDEFSGTYYEPLMQHHLAMSFFEKGDYKAAATRFRAALEQRQQMGSAEHLVNASAACLALAEERARN